MTKPSASFCPDADTTDERRQHRRRPVLLKATLYQRGTLFDCFVNNLSSRGAGVIVEVQILNNGMDVEPGAVVTLTLDRFGDFPGTVAWHEAQYAGISFLQEPARIHALIEALMPLEKV